MGKLESADPERHYEEALDLREREGRLRTLSPFGTGSDKWTLTDPEGETVLNFCSNDYLGLSGRPELAERSARYAVDYGTGSASSRLVSGSLCIHHELENRIAELYDREAALLFGSGFQANSTLLPALAGREDLILADKHVHNSILQGGAAGRARFRRFRHNDPGHLETLLRRFREKNSRSLCLVVTESIFSMDGDRAPIDLLAGLCKRYGALLMVDEAHAFGLYGDRGLGLAAADSRVDLILGTFGKSAGGYGAFLLSSERIRRYLVNHCPGFIYTTAPPPPSIGAADAALDLIPDMESERRHLAETAERFRNGLQEAGLDPGDSSSQIVPILLNSEESSLEGSRQLYRKGYYIQAIRPPTVRRSRLRLTLCTWHSREQLDRLMDHLNELGALYDS